MPSETAVPYHILSSSVPDEWPDLGYGKFIRIMRCDGERYAALFERAIRVRCQAKKCEIPAGRVLFHFFSRDTGQLIESREGPFRRRPLLKPD